MLSPLAHPAVSHPNYTASIAPDKPKPSPYSPPSDLQPGVPNVRTHPLLVKGDVTFSREITWSSNPDKPQILSNRLVVETGDTADDIHVRSWPGDKLQFIVNGRSYVLDAKALEGPDQDLWIKTNGGNDRVIVDDDVKNSLKVEGGDANDFIQAGGGMSWLSGQDGNDTLLLGSKGGIAEGNNGNDALIGSSSGNTILFGNDGNDTLIAGFGSAYKQNYLDGGNGNDTLHAGSGKNVLVGRDGDDHFVGHDHTDFYTGDGNDTIRNNKSTDRIVAGATDHFDRTQGSAFTEVKPGKTSD